MNHDSSYPFDFVPLDGSGEIPAPFGADAPEVPLFDLNSNDPLPEIEAQFGTSSGSIRKDPSSAGAADVSAAGQADAATSSGLWLEGDVLMCACPDCQAPMTIRTWLMIADCWNCAASIELSEEQEREAQKLMQQRQPQTRKSATGKPTSKPVPPAAKQESPRPAPSKARQRTPSAPAPQPAAKQPRPASKNAPNSKTPAKKPTGSAKQKPRPKTPPPKAPGQSAPAAPRSRRKTDPAHASGPRKPDRRRTTPMVGPRARIRSMAKSGTTEVVVRNALRDTPAWVMSMVVHLVLLTFLALFIIPPESDDQLITLSAAMSDDIREGERKVKINPQDELKFDLPIPPDMNIRDKKVRESLVRADQDARQLRLDADAQVPLPEITAVKERISKSGAHSPLAARDPRVRVEVIEKEGGTTLTEAAVARGLRYLDKTQRDDGRWVLKDGGGSAKSDSAATSLALLPFLGAGQTHLSGRYRKTVASGLRWLVDQQKENGDLRTNGSMYAQGQGAIVLCEAYMTTGDHNLREPAQKAIEFIEKAQYTDGGWQYVPFDPARGSSQRGDTSVVGWQLMALQSAKAAGLEVDDKVLLGAVHFLDGVTDANQAKYRYQPGKSPTPTMTAEALLCRMYLGWKKDNPGMTMGMRWLTNEHLPSKGKPDIYYWYYGTQAFHHMGGDAWDKWNQRMRDILVNTQITEGDANAGSWPIMKGDRHAGAGGKIYTTSLAVCTLEVYYRHLPIFRQLDLD